MTTPRIEEMHKYIDSTVHAYCDYNVYSELKDLLSAVEEENNKSLTQARQAGIDEAVEVVEKQQVLNYGRAEWISKDNLLEALQDNK